MGPRPESPSAMAREGGTAGTRGISRFDPADVTGSLTGGKEAVVAGAGAKEGKPPDRTAVKATMAGFT
jgi:hypothetical protein